jgi:hypothetical protein
MTEKCERYEAEIAHNEKALDEIHETCSKFENAGFENEHVIQELFQIDTFGIAMSVLELHVRFQILHFQI